MKRLLLLTISAIVLVTITNAQITRGTVLVGGNAGTSISQSDAEPRTKYTNYNINPAIGFTIRDNHVLGVDAGFGHIGYASQETRDERDTYYAGMFYRRYFSLGKGFYLFGQGNAGYTLTDADRYSHQSFGGRKTRSNAVGVSLYPGVAYTVNRRVHLEIAMSNLVNLSYGSGTVKDYAPGVHTEWKESGFNFFTNANPQSNMAVGFRIALGK